MKNSILKEYMKLVKGGVKKRYVICEASGYSYRDIGHCSGDIIWWLDNNGEMHEKVSKCGIDDFHTKLMGNKADVWWRGRATAGKKGVVTILPPTRVYASKHIRLPENLMDKIINRFEPKVMLVDTPYEGLKKVDVEEEYR
jgi:hypothetical protein